MEQPVMRVQYDGLSDRLSWRAVWIVVVIFLGMLFLGPC